ncbi:MAG: glycosyltransferase [Rhodospirillaceae bacterium]|nr:glycosyltransferase [Rhodospirillales bacterium]
MSQPLVSIIMFCKNRRQTIGRAVESLLAQTYGRVEIVVQDGASTDGTLDILRSYGSAIELVSQPDSGNNEAFLKALQRCRGTYVGSCLSDEELLPDAVERVVAHMEAHPQVDAMTGDADIIDLDGKITGEHISGPFSLMPYLTGQYCPYFVSSFFRRQALVDVGVMGDDWHPHCIEFEIWCRLGMNCVIDYVPGKFGRYGIHPQQLSNLTSDIDTHMDARTQVIERMFAAEGFFSGADGDCLELKLNILARQSAMQYTHMKVIGMHEGATRYWGLFRDQAHQLARHLARQDGLVYDEARVEATIMNSPEWLFMPEAKASLAQILAAPALARPETPPRRLRLPPLAPALYRVAGREFSRNGQSAKAEECRRCAGD